MTDEDELAMAEYGITSETKLIFHFEGHRYDRLSDAVNYAKSPHRVPQSVESQKEK